MESPSAIIKKCKHCGAEIIPKEGILWESKATRQYACSFNKKGVVKRVHQPLTESELIKQMLKRYGN